MILQIFYTPRFEETLESVYNFINDKFGQRAADRFVAKAEKTIELIAEYPFMYKTSSIDENIRIGLISKQTSLFYLVTDTFVLLG
jgi:plasmid stabilization system protein ParE